MNCEEYCPLGPALENLTALTGSFTQYTALLSLEIGGKFYKAKFNCSYIKKFCKWKDSKSALIFFFRLNGG
jgi:hypothetical protein